VEDTFAGVLSDIAGCAPAKREDKDMIPLLLIISQILRHTSGNLKLLYFASFQTGLLTASLTFVKSKSSSLLLKSSFSLHLGRYQFSELYKISKGVEHEAEDI